VEVGGFKIEFNADNGPCAGPFFSHGISGILHGGGGNRQH
jgi:hypothetical protein